MWLRKKKKKKLKSLIKFHSTNKIDYNGGGVGWCTEGKNEKKKEIQKNLQNMSKHKNNKCFFVSVCCQSPFPLWESQSTSPP